ncbi:hypothetical protein Lsan_3440 [Legionella santicrucis]|uniref:Secreted protein n=1 Tax=Legionella santicrucis TaxID=45074 RepID=A0A0W0YD62_9GAMM|nr:hypothetical protein [Legionella santicrucis]KTD54791.1 hypothetical protein Lsan_3440 [Legionella santicrucis]
MIKVCFNECIKGLSLFLIGGLCSLSFAGSASCIDLNTGKEVQIDIEDNTSRGMEVYIMEPDADLKGRFYNLTRFWDGHSKGLLTGEGVSIVYKDNFGNKSVEQINAYLSYNYSKQPGQGWIKSFKFDSCSITW